MRRQPGDRPRTSAKTKAGNKPRGHKPNDRRERRLARNTPEIELQIERIGSRGDGVGNARYTVDYETKDRAVFVPASLVGEVVRVRPTTLNAQGLTAELIELIRPSAHRTSPACDVFGNGNGCGGCSFQHVDEAGYRALKDEQFTGVLERAGIDRHSGLIRPPIWTPMAGRRRARLSYRRTAEALVIGFAGRGSHFIYELTSCGVLTPALKALIGRLKDWAEPCFSPGATGQMAVNMLAGGADILVRPDQQMTPDEITRLSERAAAAGLARLSVRTNETAAPLLLMEAGSCHLHQDKTVGGACLQPPPGSFLQASAQGETALVKTVLEAVFGPDEGPGEQADAPDVNVVDFYCGAGTFSLALLARGVKLAGYEADKAALDGLVAAARNAGFGNRVSAHQRDLAAAPVRAEELEEADILLLDPPRQGASAQVAELARLAERRQADARLPTPVILPKIIMVSCNPHTAVRDIAVLTAAGWAVSFIQMVDQFVRTAHSELVACLIWPELPEKSGPERREPEKSGPERGQA